MTDTEIRLRPSSHGQSLVYSYYSNGWVKSIDDVTNKMWTVYEYDLDGRHTLERTIEENRRALQDTHLTYDALGRLIRAADASFDVEYAYDAVGNRRNIASVTDNGYIGLFGSSYPGVPSACPARLLTSAGTHF